MNMVEEVDKVLAQGEVSLIVDNYDEIFSSFDPRPYSHRALSVDFLDEARRATREVEPEKFELRLLLPAAKRNLEKEATIKKRLHEHFRKHADRLIEEDKIKKRRGIFLAIIGFLMMMLATYILHTTKKGLGFDILYIIFEPAGWFTVWTGLDLIFSFAKEKNHDLEFYKKMTNAEVSFSHY